MKRLAWALLLSLACSGLPAPVKAQLWTSGIAIPVPAPAAAHSFNTRAFFDDFNSTSTIDLTNAKTAGFNWYTNGAWPNVPNSTNWSAAPAVASGDISVASSAVTVNKGANGGITALNTAVALASNNYRGTTFAGSAGMYVEWRFKYDPSLSAVGCSAWPIVWMGAIEFERGNISNGHFLEPDLVEIFCQANGAPTISSNRFDWTYNGSNYSGTHTTADAVSQTPDTAYHTMGFLWVPTTQNSGTGLFQVYYDGVHKTGNDITYTSSGLATPGATGGGGNVNGLFFIGESQNFSLMIGAGNLGGSNWPITVDYISVWCTSTSCKTVQP